MAITQAIEFLRAALGGGSLLANDVRARAKAAGVSWAAVRRAKQRIGVVAVRESEGSAGAGRWLWSLPKAQQGGQDAQQAQLQAAQPLDAQPQPAQSPRQRVITVKRSPVGPDEISHEEWRALGCSVERLKEFLRQRSTETANV